MARTAGKKQAPQKFEEPDEAEGWEDAVVDADDKDAAANLRLRDWRDVERFREMKELRRLVDDDYGLGEIFHVPLKPRAEPVVPGQRKPAKAVPVPAKTAGKPAAKELPKKAAPKAHTPVKPGKPEHKPAARHKPAKLKAKAKRR